MTIEQMKKAMLAYEDFYGGDLIGLEKVKDAKTKEELEDILDEHYSHMECMLSDAQSHLNNFKRKLGL